MELALYDLSLLIVGGLDLAMAIGLLVNNYAYRHYPVYHRSRVLTAVFFAVFGIGLLLHYHFHWRQTCPPMAMALSLTYFHIAGVAITWSHTSLLNPRYLSRRVVARDVAFLIIGLSAYWLTTVGVYIFLLHATLMTYDFYSTYYHLNRHSFPTLGKVGGRAIFRWMLLSCHLIIFFGIGSIDILCPSPKVVSMLSEDAPKILRTRYPAQFQRSGRVSLPAGDSLIGEFLPQDEFGTRAAVHVSAADEQDTLHGTIWLVIAFNTYPTNQRLRCTC